MGHGYCASGLAASLGPGWRRIGTVRGAEKAARLEAEGVAPLLWDDEAGIRDAIAQATHVLASIAPSEDGDPALARYGDALEAADNVVWAGYLSTTGVYGDAQGGWVDETTPLEPVNARSRRRVAAERAWLATGLPVHLFRLAGIYGPGRNALMRHRQGKARRIIRPGQFFSRVHRADVVQVLRASMERPAPGQAYNVADDEPAPPQDLVAYAAELLGEPCPPDEDFETADLTPMARSFYLESKRVANRRIREELGVTLLYPNYRAGLKALLRQEN